MIHIYKIFRTWTHKRVFCKLKRPYFISWVNHGVYCGEIAHVLSRLHSRLFDSRGLLYYNRWTLISAWISNHMFSKVRGEITYPFPNCQPSQQLHHWSLGMDKWFQPALYNRSNYLFMLGLKLNHGSKMGPRRLFKNFVNLPMGILMHEHLSH